MLPIRTILHPTDFSSGSRCAWEMACALARDYGARLMLVYVEPPLASLAKFGAVSPEPTNWGVLQRQLAEIEATDDGLTIVRTVLVGDEAEEINRFAKENQVDLIVMGTHGRTGLSRLLMGSVAESVLREAPCPVMTIKSPMKAPATVQLEREAVAV